MVLYMYIITTMEITIITIPTLTITTTITTMTITTAMTITTIAHGSEHVHSVEGLS